MTDTPDQTRTTAQIGPKTVTVLGGHWNESAPWGGFDFTRADLRSHNVLGVEDYHLGVPWMHPDDRRTHDDDPDWWCIYRLRLKRGWRSFVKVGDEWRVSKEPAAHGTFGTPPNGQIRAIIEVNL